MTTTSYVGSNNFSFLVFDDTTGNIAIGSSNIDPSNKLYVAGNIFTASNLSVSGSLTAVQGITVCNSTFLANSNDTSNTPSFSWRQESNTGIYHPSNQTIGMSINGVEKLRFNNTGLGLNSINPSNLLDVIGTAYISTRLGVGVPVPGFALDVAGAVNATTYCNILINSFSNPSTFLAPTALALSNVYSTSIFASNSFVFPSNTAVYASNSIVFPSNTSVYASNSIVFPSNTSAYASNTSVFASNVSIYSSNLSVFGSNLGIFCSNTSTFASNNVIFSSNAATYSSNAAAFSSNNIVFCSNTAVYASNTSVSSSNAAIYASNTANYASNITISSNIWKSSNNIVYLFSSNVGIGKSNITNPLEVAGNSIFYSNVIIYGTCSNSIGVSPTPGSIINTRVLTSGITYTPSAGTMELRIEILGGGGAGGGKANATTIYAGGGGSGAYGYLVLTTGVSSTSNYTYSIGAGGTGVVNGAGGNGGGTSITVNAVTYTAGGGLGAPNGASAQAWSGGIGGVTTGAFTFSNPGHDGGVGFQFNTISGAGGSSPYGSGGVPKTSTNPGTGSNATGYGSGGSGAGSSAVGTLAGGNGTPGFIIIHEYT
jgi:hypothetical protein